MQDNDAAGFFIALVDDEPRIHAMICDVLKQASVVSRFESFYDPYSFVAFLKQSSPPPDLVLLDVHFANAGLSGIDILPYVREDHPYLPVILLTGMEGQDIEPAHNYECVYYIPKPVQPEQLVRMVRFYLTTGRKSGRLVAGLREDLDGHKRLVQELSTELAQAEINSWSAEQRHDSSDDRSAFQRILDIVKAVLHATELAPSMITDLEDLFRKDFQLFQKTIQTIVRFNATDTPPPGMRVHRFHAVEGVYSLSITHKARVLYHRMPATGKTVLLRLDPEHNDRLMEKWLKDNVERTI